MMGDGGEARDQAVGLQPKAPGASKVTLSQPMELRHGNLMGNVHGSEIMKLIDSAAGIAASRHAGGVVALDEAGRPRPVAPLEPETEQERRRQAEAKIRREIRLARAEAIRRQRGAAEARG